MIVPTGTPEIACASTETVSGLKAVASAARAETGQKSIIAPKAVNQNFIVISWRPLRGGAGLGFTPIAPEKAYEARQQPG